MSQCVVISLRVNIFEYVVLYLFVQIIKLYAILNPEYISMVSYLKY